MEEELRACVEFVCVILVTLRFLYAFYCPESKSMTCPICEAIYWYRKPQVFEDLEKCDCYMHSCNSLVKYVFVLLILFLDNAHGAGYMNTSARRLLWGTPQRQFSGM